MKWNYRILERKNKIKNKIYKFYEIYEVYYNKNNKITAISKDSISPGGENLKELENDIKYMSEAFQLPILKYDKIKFHKFLSEK